MTWSWKAMIVKYCLHWHNVMFTHHHLTSLWNMFASIVTSLVDPIFGQYFLQHSWQYFKEYLVKYSFVDMHTNITDAGLAPLSSANICNGISHNICDNIPKNIWSNIFGWWAAHWYCGGWLGSTGSRRRKEEGRFSPQPPATNRL